MLNATEDLVTAGALLFLRNDACFELFMDVDAIDLLPRLIVSHLALVGLFRRSGDFAVCHDWMEDTADAEDGKE